MTSIPVWAVRDADAVEFVPSEGWLKDYVEYMSDSTDAPTIYHVGVGLTTLAAAAASMDLCVQQHDGREYLLPMQLWSVIVGLSGDRKSRVMEVGVSLFTRAREASAEPDAILPPDGSIEAWHDYMSGSNNVLLYRDELAFLLDQSRRGYSEGLKSWLMTLYSGRQHTRVIRPRQGEGKDVRRIVIERPRVSILGGIPPDTFRSKTGRGDWRSGFLARMVFWPGQRERYQEMPTTDLHQESRLTKWLNRVPVRSRGRLVIPVDSIKRLTDWYYEEIESKRNETAQEVFSHLTRYQDLCLRVAALYTLSRLDKPQLSEARSVVVPPEDVELAIELADSLRRSMILLYAAFRASGEGEIEVDCLSELSRNHPDYVTIQELQQRFPQYPLRQIRATLTDLSKAGLVAQGKKVGAGQGRPPAAFRIVSGPHQD